MAYKSRVTNKYMGSSFAGQVASSNKSSTTDLINTLQREVNPALAKIADQYVETKKDTAKEKINQLFLTKDSKTIQQEILAGKHPELSNAYVSKVVDLHSGKKAAVETMVKIAENKDSYDIENDNLPAFYKQFYPEFKQQSSTYALGFASVFEPYKSKAAIQDAIKRAELAKLKRFDSISSVLDTVSDPNEYHKQANSFIVQIPPEEGSNKIRYLNSPSEMNEYVLQNLTNSLNTATSNSEISRIESIIKADRGVGKGGNKLGSIYSNKNNPKYSKLVSNLIEKRNTIANATWTATERANTVEKREALQKIIKMDDSTPEGVVKQQEAIKTLIDKFPQSAGIIKATLGASDDLLENTDVLSKIKRDVNLGKYDNKSPDILLQDIREASGGKSTTSEILQALAASELRRNSNYKVPTENPTYKKTVKQLNTLLADKIKTKGQYDTGKKQQLISDIVSKDLEEEWLDWNSSKEGQRPSKSASIDEQNAWTQKSSKWLREKYLDYVKQYDNPNWLNAMGDRLDRLSLSEYQGLDKEDKVVEYYEGEVEKFVKTLTAKDVEDMQQQSISELIPVSQLIQKTGAYKDLMASKGFQIFKDDPRTKDINEGMKVVQDIMDSLNLTNVDYTDDLNKVKDSIAAFTNVINIPEIQKTLGIFTDSDSVEKRGQVFLEGLSTISGRSVSKQFYETNFTETDKENLAKAFNINTEQLNELANEYLK